MISRGNSVSLYVRKINSAKWEQNDIRSGEDISADAITSCLRTSGNILSVWEIDSENRLEEAILAMVSAGDHLATMDFAVMNAGHLLDNDIESENNEGNTLVHDLRDTHRHLVELTYPKLGTIACHIVDCFKEEKIHRYRIAALKGVLQTAIDKDRLDADDLSVSIKKNLGLPTRECSECGGNGECQACRGTGRV